MCNDAGQQATATGAHGAAARPVDTTSPAGRAAAPRSGVGRLRPPGRRAAAGLVLALVAAALWAPPARAQEHETPSVQFNAFGTFGLAYSTEGDADYVWNVLRPDGPGHGERISMDLDSNLGAQATARLLPRLTAVVQVVADQNAKDRYTPHVEWANVQYGITRQLSVRVGRTVLAAFLASDYRKISYANPWVRPPVEVYGLVPAFAVDGIDATYHMHAGDWTTRLHAAFGRSDLDTPGGGKARTKNHLNASVTLERGGLTARAAFTRGDLTVTAFDDLFDGFRSFGPAGQAIASRFDERNRPFEFATVGMEYDPGRWFVMSELGWTQFHGVFGEKVAGYVTGGYRVGRFTPYTTYSRVNLLSDTSTPGLDVAEVPPARAETAARLDAVLNGVLGSSAQQQAVSIGGRWDVRTGIAVTLQVDFVDRLDHSPGTYINPQPGFKPGGSAQLVSLATSFVF